jgi:hypothetical protein
MFAHKMSKTPPLSARKLAKYKNNGWVTRAIFDDHDYDGLRSGLSFLWNPYLRSLGENLRHQMTFLWLRGDFGPIDNPAISRDSVSDIWLSLIDHGYLGHNGAVMTYFLDKETEHWRNVTGKIY